MTEGGRLRPGYWKASAFAVVGIALLGGLLFCVFKPAPNYVLLASNLRLASRQYRTWGPSNRLMLGITPIASEGQTSRMY